MDNRRVVELWAHALRTGDVEAVGELVHPDVVVRYPQSGEVIRGRENYLAMLANYPSGAPATDVVEERWAPETVQVSSPLPFGVPAITVVGGGDTLIFEGVATYPDGGVFNVVSILTVHNAKVVEETSYFAAPFEPPEWRRPYVES